MSYVWVLQILTFGGIYDLHLGVTNPYVRGLDILCLEVTFYYVCGLQILTFVVRFLTFGGLQILTFAGEICYVLGVTNPYVLGLDFLH